jgi:DNA-binding LacI/PurR family transcriptional regulator
MDLTLYATFRGSSSEDILDRLIDGRIDGLALFSPEDDPLAEHLRQNPLPVIAIADAQSCLPSVIVDDIQGGVLQAEYLSAKHCKRLLYHAPAKMTVSVARRHRAFTERSKELGMDVLDVLTREIDSPLLTSEAIGVLTSSSSQRPDAIVAWEDGHADSIVDQCFAMGLRVPQDILVIGFNGLKNALRPAHRLTTICAPWDRVGLEAVHLLVSQINGKTIPLETILSVELIQGDTA